MTIVSQYMHPIMNINVVSDHLLSHFSKCFSTNVTNILPNTFGNIVFLVFLSSAFRRNMPLSQTSKGEYQLLLCPGQRSL